MSKFVHLHSHTTYSLLDGASSISGTMEKAVKDGMKGVAITDHGNMFGSFEFVAEANKAGIKPIVGCEFYLVENRHQHSFKKSEGKKDQRRHQLLLAKNQEGYHNLAKLSSLGYTEGLYGSFPRIDKEILLQHCKGVIATSCCLAASIPQMILNGDVEGAEKELQWWIEVFGEDFYIELMRHKGLEDIDGKGISQEDINQVLISFAKKYNLKIIATNDSHYLEEKDAKPHDVLLSINTGSFLSDTNRFRFSSDDYFFKTTQQMSDLFHDLPQAIDNTLDIFDKIEPLKLTRDILMPNFPIPPEFQNQTEYLRHLSYDGAKKKYGELSVATKERIDHELGIIDNMGFPGYFLITQDLINAARELGVWVGPGRGSAAGSAIAYSLGITNVDPIGYNLLFERFLNPERVSMPDIDIDFDDYGRQKVIDYVVDKYGRNQVAQIITYGTMAAKLSIRDTARVMELPLSDADRLAKLVPMKPGTKLKKILVKTLKDLSKDYPTEDIQNIEKLQEIAEANTLEGEVLRMAHSLEGSVRNTGIHAAGVIIAPSDIREYIPVRTAKDAELFITQYDGRYIESAGMLKMDFLGLKTLSILKDAVENIVIRYGEDHRIELDDIPLDDKKTYELFQRGDMIGIFQFESEGMRKHMRDLKPTDIEDLIAMNALYRPGPMDNIPTYIARKHGKEVVKYPHPMLEEILKPTFGIMVYQEQIMQAAQIMAGYSLGQADVLRRAMGKKKKSEMEKQSAIFVKGAGEKGVPEDQAREVFSIMERFASYGFNRSHAACYAILAFQTGYLKANYKPEFMASVMTHSKNDLTKLKFFLDECKRIGVEVLGPDVNESHLNFTVNAEGKIRFGLSALKGVGEGPVNEIVAERDKNGPFESPYDMVRRLPLKAFNKRVMESLVYGGGFDFFEDLTRAQYFEPSGKFKTYMEHLLKYGNVYQHQKETAANTLFGASEDAMVPQPAPPPHITWNLMQKLTKEKEVAGIYISGHPLDAYAVEVKQFATCPIDRIMQFQNSPVKIAAFVSGANHRFTKRGDGFGFFTLEDYASTTEIALFKEDYQQYKNLLEPGSCVLIDGTIRMDRYRGEWVLKVNNVNLLSSLLESKTSTIEIQLPLAQIQPNFLSQLETVFKENKGKKTLRFSVIDPKNKQVVKFLSEKRKVKIDDELMTALQDMNLTYKLS